MWNLRSELTWEFGIFFVPWYFPDIWICDVCVVSMWNSLQISINSNEPGRAKANPTLKKVAHCCSTPMNLLDVPEWLNSVRRSKIRPRSCFQPRNILSCMWNCYSRAMNDRDPSRLNSLFISSFLNQSSLDRGWAFLRARDQPYQSSMFMW